MIIDKELLKLQKKIMENRKQSGGFWSKVSSTIWSSTSAIDLNELWGVVTKIQQDNCRHLLQDIARLKVKNIT
jgi:hypothetical protein